MEICLLIVEVAIQIASGLKAAHDAGILHRDITIRRRQDLEGKKPKVQIYWESRAKIMGIRNNNFKIKSNEKRNI